MSEPMDTRRLADRCVHCGEPVSLNRDGNLAHEFGEGDLRWWLFNCQIKPYGIHSATLGDDLIGADDDVR